MGSGSAVQALAYIGPGSVAGTSSWLDVVASADAVLVIGALAAAALVVGPLWLRAYVRLLRGLPAAPRATLRVESLFPGCGARAAFVQPSP